MWQHSASPCDLPRSKSQSPDACSECYLVASLACSDFITGCFVGYGRAILDFSAYFEASVPTALLVVLDLGGSLAITTGISMFSSCNDSRRTPRRCGCFALLRQGYSARSASMGRPHLASLVRAVFIIRIFGWRFRSRCSSAWFSRLVHATRYLNGRLAVQELQLYFAEQTGSFQDVMGFSHGKLATNRKGPKACRNFNHDHRSFRDLFPAILRENPPDEFLRLHTVIAVQDLPLHFA